MSPVQERSIGELFSDLARDTSTLIRQEVALAKVEMSEKASRAGKDIALIAGGALVAYLGVLLLLVAAVIGLGHLIGYGFSALILGVIIGGAGAAVTMKGIGDMKNGTLRPEKTAAMIKETKQWAKEQMN